MSRDKGSFAASQSRPLKLTLGSLLAAMSGFDVRPFFEELKQIDQQPTVAERRLSDDRRRTTRLISEADPCGERCTCRGRRAADKQLAWENARELGTFGG
jgi:hypothetical protein